MSKIIGQDKLIKEVNRIFQVFVNSNCKIRPHFILTGESGSGKSFTIKQLCDMNELSFLEVNAAQITKERYPNSKFIIIVCHAVNDKGLINMCNNFDQVIVSNSHRDINYRPSNENLTVIDVCK